MWVINQLNLYNIREKKDRSLYNLVIFICVVCRYQIENGLVKYRFECGSGEGLVIIPKYISDGQWHKIVVDRRGKNAEILLDDEYSAQATAPGTNDVLNLHDKDVYFGAQVNLGPNNQRDVINGFDGCMEDIKIYNIHLPINGSNSVATEQSFEKVEFYCRDSTNMFHNTSKFELSV